MASPFAGSPLSSTLSAFPHLRRIVSEVEQEWGRLKPPSAREAEEALRKRARSPSRPKAPPRVQPAGRSSKRKPFVASPRKAEWHYRGGRGRGQGRGAAQQKQRPGKGGKGRLFFKQLRQLRALVGAQGAFLRDHMPVVGGHRFDIRHGRGQAGKQALQAEGGKGGVALEAKNVGHEVVSVWRKGQNYTRAGAAPKDRQAPTGHYQGRWKCPCRRPTPSTPAAIVAGKRLGRRR